MANTFLHKSPEYYVFDFSCDCGHEGELGVPRSFKKLIPCPDCGALYFMTPPRGMFAQPRLLTVCTSAGAAASA